MYEKPNKVTYGYLTVSYFPRLDGGGKSFGQDFVPVVREIFGKVERACEFGAGPGFIGFSLMANGLCDSLCLIDVNPEAVQVCRRTIQENSLQGKVRVYLSDGLTRIPDSEQWDLVVGNPPHFKGTLRDFAQDPRTFDPYWNVHAEFYRNIRRYLAPNGSVLFVENLVGSKPSLWKEMIRAAGLDFVKCFRYIPVVTPQGRSKRRSYRSISKLLALVREKRIDIKKWQSFVESSGRALFDTAWRSTLDYPYYFVWCRVVEERPTDG